jgi:hypothetical protein
MNPDNLLLGLDDTLSQQTAKEILIQDEYSLYGQKIADVLDFSITESVNINSAIEHKTKDKLLQTATTYTYEELINKFKDLSTVVDNFLPDWYTLRFLQKESILDRASVARVAVSLSNLFRLAVENEIDEIHLVTLRIRKIFIEDVNKDVFVITDY